MEFTKEELKRIQSMSYVEKVALVQHKLKAKFKYPKEIYQDIILLLDKIINVDVDIDVESNNFYDCGAWLAGVGYTIRFIKDVYLDEENKDI